MKARGEYRNLRYEVRLEDVSERPPFRNLEVELWENSDEIGEYDFKEVYTVTALTSGKYQVENITGQKFSDGESQRILTREKGETKQIVVGQHEQELERFAEEIIESLER